MRKLVLSMLVIGHVLYGYGQTDSLAAMLKEGVRLNDQGDYTGAIARYDAILAVNDRYFGAYVEKSTSFCAAGRYQECAELSRKLIKEFPEEADLKHVYVSYGTAMDGLGKPDEAIKIYKEGMRKFPNFYLLPFNKGTTEVMHQQNENAVKDFEASITFNRGHASSHLYMAYAVYPTNKMAAAMSLCGFLFLEPKGKRAEKHLPMLLGILGANVQKKDDKTINISLSPSVVGKEKGEDDFRNMELMMRLATAAGMTEKAKDTTAVGQLKSKLEILAEANPEKKGFFSLTYVVLFIGLRDAGLLETAAHVLYQSANDASNQQWLEDHPGKVKDFFQYISAWTKQ